MSRWIVRQLFGDFFGWMKSRFHFLNRPTRPLSHVTVGFLGKPAKFGQDLGIPVIGRQIARPFAMSGQRGGPPRVIQHAPCFGRSLLRKIQAAIS